MFEKRRVKGDGRAAFLAHLERIKAEIGASRPQRSVYIEYADVLKISYSQFTHYVRLYIKGVKSEAPISQPENPAATIPALAPVPQKVESAKQEKPETPAEPESAPRKGPVFVAPKPKPPYIHDPTKIDIDALVGRKR